MPTRESHVCPSRELISRANCIGKNCRNNKIYEKQLASVIENCERKSNYTKGKFKTFRTQSFLNYGYSVDLPFRLELNRKSYACLKHRVTLRIYLHLVLWIKVRPPIIIWPAHWHMRNTFDSGVMNANASHKPRSFWSAQQRNHMSSDE